MGLLLLLSTLLNLFISQDEIELTYFETENSFKKGYYIELCMLFPFLSGLIVLCVISTVHYKKLPLSPSSVSLSRLGSF